MKKCLLLIISLITLGNLNFAQNTVGLLSYQPAQSYDGFNLMYPHNQSTVYLLDNCGEIVHAWTDEANFRPGNIAYIQPDGSLVKAKRDAVVTDDAIWAGGGGEIVEIRDWNNNLIWDFVLNDSSDRLHHDIAPMPNGNILMIVWELKTEAEAIEAGRDPASMSQAKLWPDYIIEVDPNTDEIVWEWHVWDHLIQDFDDTKSNYGVVEDHPELIDINFQTNDGHPDWMHSNAMDYNEELDQIVLSVPTFHEIWVIDHSTTTAQAASHNGGLGGRGGDLLFRWGNPATYRAGTEADQKLFYSHDIHWIDDFVEVSFPHYNKFAVFNNRVGADYSTVNIFNPGWDMYTWSYTSTDGTFDPDDFDVTITHPDVTALHSTGLSSIQLLPNGNTLICSGRYGYSFEITPNDEIVWEYKTPLLGGNPITQGDTLAINNNLTFRMKRYPTDFTAFEGKDLSQKGWIELEPDSFFCDLLLPVDELLVEQAFKIYPNPASNYLTVEWDGMMHLDIEVYNAVGQRVAAYPECSGGRKYINSSLWPKGVYFVSIDSKYTKRVVIH